MILRIEGIEIDLIRSGIWRDNRLTPVPRRVIDVLVHLVDHAERPVSLEELREEVWGGKDVGDSSIVEALRQARVVLGPREGGDEFIESVYGHGYRFSAAQVHKMWVGTGDSRRVVTFRDPEPPAPQPPTDLLTRLFDAALAGHVGIVLVCGDEAHGVRDAGLAEASDRDMEVVTGVCAESRRSAGPIAWHAVASQLGLLFDPARGSTSRLAEFERFARAMRRHASERGLLVVLEALHEADLDTLRLCECVGSLARGARILILGTYEEEQARETERDAALGELIRQTGARVLRAG